MSGLMIRPGDHNGEDITVEVTVTSIESNPSELGPNEIAKELVTVVDTFVVPIDPVVQGNPVLTIPNSSASGLEDNMIDLGTFNVSLDGITDTDGSEIYYVEIDQNSYPVKTKFWVDRVRQTGTSFDGWLRLPGTENAQISIRGPPNFSGMINLSVRGHIVDFTMSGQASAPTAPQSIAISVYPVADGITPPTSKTVGVEDNGPVAFGNTLASTGLEPTDNGRKAGNNPESETVSQILFVIPENTETLTYTITGGSGNGTAQVSFDAGTRTYLISSTVLSSISDLATLTQAQREEAEQDIRDTLATFQVEIGPKHNDANGNIAVTVTTLDVNLGKYATKDVDLDHDIVIQAVADTPSIFVHDTDQ